MAKPTGTCETPGGNRALVCHLDRYDLAGLAPALHAWISSDRNDGGVGVSD